MSREGSTIHWQDPIDSEGDHTPKLENHAILGLQFPDIFSQLVAPESWEAEEKYHHGLGNKFPVQKVEGPTWQQQVDRSRKQTDFQVAICIEALQQMLELAQHGLIVGDRNSRNWMLEKNPAGTLRHESTTYNLIQIDLSHVYDTNQKAWSLDDETWYPDQHVELNEFSQEERDWLFDEVRIVLAILRGYLFTISSREQTVKEKALLRELEVFLTHGSVYFRTDTNVLSGIIQKLQSFQP